MEVFRSVGLEMYWVIAVGAFSFELMCVMTNLTVHCFE